VYSACARGGGGESFSEGMSSMMAGTAALGDDGAGVGAAAGALAEAEGAAAGRAGGAAGATGASASRMIRGSSSSDSSISCDPVFGAGGDPPSPSLPPGALMDGADY
jgi:hypothetical protein